MCRFRAACATQSQARASLMALKSEFRRELYLLSLVQGLRRNDVRVIFVPSSSSSSSPLSPSKPGNLEEGKGGTGSSEILIAVSTFEEPSGGGGGGVTITLSTRDRDFAIGLHGRPLLVQCAPETARGALFHPAVTSAGAAGASAAGGPVGYTRSQSAALLFTSSTNTLTLATRTCLLYTSPSPRD